MGIGRSPGKGSEFSRLPVLVGKYFRALPEVAGQKTEDRDRYSEIGSQTIKKTITKTRNLKSTKCLEQIFVVSPFRDFVMRINIEHPTSNIEHCTSKETVLSFRSGLVPFFSDKPLTVSHCGRIVLI